MGLLCFLDAFSWTASYKASHEEDPSARAPTRRMPCPPAYTARSYTHSYSDDDEDDYEEHCIDYYSGLSYSCRRSRYSSSLDDSGLAGPEHFLHREAIPAVPYHAMSQSGMRPGTATPIGPPALLSDSSSDSDASSSSGHATPVCCALRHASAARFAPELLRGCGCPGSRAERCVEGDARDGCAAVGRCFCPGAPACGCGAAHGLRSTGDDWWQVFTAQQHFRSGECEDAMDGERAEVCGAGHQADEDEKSDDDGDVDEDVPRLCIECGSAVCVDAECAEDGGSGAGEVIDKADAVHT